MDKTFAGFGGADFRFRWIQEIAPKCRLLAFFWGRMSPWCSFRCTCLDELASISQMSISSVALVWKGVSQVVLDSEAHG